MAKRQDNHTINEGETVMGLIDNDNLAELAALDALPIPIRRARARRPFCRLDAQGA